MSVKVSQGVESNQPEEAGCCSWLKEARPLGDVPLARLVLWTA